MKLQHLPIGARFEYQGRVFVKTGPLTATAEEGGQQVIPRYAVLRPLDLPEPEPAAGGSPRRVDPARVRKAFETFYGVCLRHVDAAALPTLEAARADFLAALK